MSAALFLSATLAAAPPPVFTSGADRVRVDVVVSHGGAALKGLPPEAFEVKDDGAVQRIEVASREEQAVHGVLVLDLSASLRPRERAALRDAAATFLRHLEPSDRATLVTFTQDVRLVSGPADPATVLAALEDLDDSGSTSLYDALYAGLVLAGAEEGRPFVLVFTDGQDQTSWLGASELTQAALRLEASVYVVSPEKWNPDTEVSMRAAQFSVPPAAAGAPSLPPRVESASRKIVRGLVASTGGQILTSRGPDGFAADFERVLAEVKNRYLLVYDVEGPPRPGWHKLEVRLKKGKGEVRARRGYFAR
jgi:VWFA-related protein